MTTPTHSHRYHDFEQIFSAIFEELLANALRLCRNREDAEDLIQETAVRAWMSWERLSSEGNRKAWMHRILRNAFIDRIRRGKRERTMLERWKHHRNHTLQARARSEEVWSKGVGDEVLFALLALKVEQRTVLLRVDVEGQSYVQVSEELGWPMGTVMSRLHRARKIMQEELHAYAMLHGYKPHSLAA